MTDWVRLWHDMPTDPKWRVVSRKSKQPLPCVLAVFTLMLTNASGNAGERGCLLAWNDEDAGAALDMDAEDVCAIREAMQGKVLDGDRLTGWERRQPKREDSTAAERKANWKARKNAERDALERSGTQGNAAERTREDTDTDTDTDIDDDDAGASAPPDLIDLTDDLCRSAGIRHVEPQRIIEHHKLVGGWLGEGFDPDQHIRPAIRQAVADATERIASLRYFDQPIRQFRARQEANDHGHERQTRGAKSRTLDAAEHAKALLRQRSAHAGHA